MGEQIELMNQLNEYIMLTGVKARFIAKQIDLPEDTLSRFRRGQKELYFEHFVKLKNWLELRKEYVT